MPLPHLQFDSMKSDNVSISCGFELTDLASWLLAPQLVAEDILGSRPYRAHMKTEVCQAFLLSPKHDRRWCRGRIL